MKLGAISENAIELVNLKYGKPRLACDGGPEFLFRVGNRSIRSYDDGLAIIETRAKSKVTLSVQQSVMMCAKKPILWGRIFGKNAVDRT